MFFILRETLAGQTLFARRQEWDNSGFIMSPVGPGMPDTQFSGSLLAGTLPEMISLRDRLQTLRAQRGMPSTVAVVPLLGGKCR